MLVRDRNGWRRKIHEARTEHHIGWGTRGVLAGGCNRRRRRGAHRVRAEVSNGWWWRTHRNFVHLLVPSTGLSEGYPAQRVFWPAKDQSRTDGKVE